MVIIDIIAALVAKDFLSSSTHGGGVQSMVVRGVIGVKVSQVTYCKTELLGGSNVRILNVEP